MHLDKKCERTLKSMFYDRDYDEICWNDPKVVSETFTAVDILRYPNTGPITLKKIREWLAAHGLSLLQDETPRNVPVLVVNNGQYKAIKNMVEISKVPHHTIDDDIVVVLRVQRR